VDGAPALGGEAVVVLGQPSFLEGCEGLDVEFTSCSAGGFQHSGFEVVDADVAIGYSDGGTHRYGILCRLNTRLSHIMQFG